MRAAVDGFKFVQLMLAELYSNGLGVEQDEDKALHWYQQYEKQSHVQTQNCSEDGIFFNIRKTENGLTELSLYYNVTDH